MLRLDPADVVAFIEERARLDLTPVERLAVARALVEIVEGECQEAFRKMRQAGAGDPVAFYVEAIAPAYRADRATTRGLLMAALDARDGVDGPHRGSSQ